MTTSALPRPRRQRSRACPPPDRLVVPGLPRTGTTPAGAFNLLVDQQPAAVVLAADERDVIAAVRLRPRARPAGRAAGDRPQRRAARLARRTRSSSTSAASTTSRSTPRRAASASAPACAGSRSCPQLSELGLAALHGSSPDVGIAGYSLGGGMGWLARKHGLQTNSVTAFELVTADGHLRPHRRRPRARPVLGAARRRRQLRRRHRDRVRGLPRRGALRGRDVLPVRARAPRCCTRGASCCRRCPTS